MTGWPDVARALLGSWPNQVAGWGGRAIDAYLDELKARGLTPAQALTAIRSADAGPAPNAATLAKLARTDPDAPTWPEAYSAIYDPHPACGGRGVMWTRGRGGQSDNDARLDRAYEIHPLLGAFVQAYGPDRLATLEVDHDEYGAVRQRDLQSAWDRFTETNAHRDRAALAAGRRRELARSGPRQLNSLAALQANQPEEE